MESVELRTGLHLHFIPADKFKTITICVLIRRPLTREDVTANALLPGILSRGCKAYPTLPEVNRALEELYGAFLSGDIVKKGEEQIIQFCIELLDRDELLNDGLQLLSQILLEPFIDKDGFDQVYTEGEKENLKNIIESRANSKKGYARYRTLEEMCWKNGRNEAFGIYGDGFKEDIDNLDRHILFQQYQNLLNTSSVDIAVIGNCNKEHLVHKISNLFTLKPTSLIELPKPSGEFEKQKRQQIDEDHGLTQGKICFGIRSGINPASDDFYHLLCMNEILGGGANSKLFTNVREKENLCYYINSFIFRFKGIIFVESGVDSDKFDKVEELLMENINAIAEGKITSDDLEAAKTSLAKKFLGISDSPTSLLDFYIGQKMLNDPLTIEALIEKINETKLEEVCQMAGQLHLDTVYRLK